MPELPEVETIKLGLQSKIIGLKIKKVQILSPKSFLDKNGKPFDYAQGLRGQKILNIWRRAKILGIDLGKVTLLFHLKMSGQLVWKGESGKGKGERFVGGHPTQDMFGNLPNSHTRVIFDFSDGSKLYFNDQRKFGWIRVVNSSSLIDNSLLKNLGPEPLEKEFSWQILKSNLLNHKSQPVKVVLMDQTVVSGIGNIYANEACFNANLDPRIKVEELSDKQFESLHRATIQSLRDGIKYGGSSKARFLDYVYVYGKDKHPCKKCGTEIKKITLGGRGTFYCSTCQKKV